MLWLLPAQVSPSRTHTLSSNDAQRLLSQRPAPPTWSIMASMHSRTACQRGASRQAPSARMTRVMPNSKLPDGAARRRCRRGRTCAYGDTVQRGGLQRGATSITLQVEGNGHLHVHPPTHQPMPTFGAVQRANGEVGQGQVGRHRRCACCAR